MLKKVEEYLIKFDKYPLFYAIELTVGNNGENIIYSAYKYSRLGQNPAQRILTSFVRLITLLSRGQKEGRLLQKNNDLLFSFQEMPVYRSGRR